MRTLGEAFGRQLGWVEVIYGPIQDSVTSASMVEATVNIYGVKHKSSLKKSHRLELPMPASLSLFWSGPDQDHLFRFQTLVAFVNHLSLEPQVLDKTRRSKTDCLFPDHCR